MGFNLNKLPSGGGNKSNQPTLEPGTYPARVVCFIDLGLQTQRPFKGEDKPPAYMIRIGYELLDVFMVDKDGNEDESKPRWVSEEIPVYNLEKDKATSTKRYKALDPEMDFDGDFSKIVGQPCMVTIVHGANKKDPTRPYENIGSVTTMRAKEAAKAPELKNPSQLFLMDDPDMAVFKKQPEFIRKKLTENLEFKGSKLEAALKGVSHDDDNDEPEDKEEW